MIGDDIQVIFGREIAESNDRVLIILGDFTKLG
jgi:hypothetical protein